MLNFKMGEPSFISLLDLGIMTLKNFFSYSGELSSIWFSLNREILDLLLYLMFI